MTARETMASALRDTGLYTLTGETLVDQELAAYGAALDVLYERIEDCKTDGFLGTAGEEGLARWEKLFGLHPLGTLEERRKVLLQYSATRGDAHTCSDFLALFQSAGLTATILEDPSGKKLCFNCIGLGNAEERADAVAYLKRFLPAHLQVTLDFRELSWNTIDRTAQTFDEWDAEDRTWDQLDLVGDALFEI